MVYQAVFTLSYSYDSNYKNVTINAKVNITNAPPEVLTVDITEGVDIFADITLLAGRTRTIYCNATIRDWNGHGDINKTNGTLWDNNNAVQSNPLNNNTLYRNTTCAKLSDDGQYIGYWQCSFDVLYYANNGSDWRCNITTVDNASFERSNFNTTILDSLYALNMSSVEIDYGNVAVEGTSENQSINVINFGNRAINVSVRGYAITEGDGLAFNCSLSGNISLGNERWSMNASQGWADKSNLTSTSADMGFLVAKQTVADTQQINTTYWQLYVPVTNNPAGACSGNVVFEATVG